MCTTAAVGAATAVVLLFPGAAAAHAKNLLQHIRKPVGAGQGAAEQLHYLGTRGVQVFVFIMLFELVNSEAVQLAGYCIG